MPTADAIRILVVDDTPSIRRELPELLSDLPTVDSVVAVGSAEEALELLARSVPDLVVLDLGLPGMPGLELLRRLSSRPNGPGVVVFSNHAEPEVRFRTKAAGAAAHFDKALEIPALVAWVEAFPPGPNRGARSPEVTP